MDRQVRTAIKAAIAAWAVAVILGNMHGGCTEHSYVQIAMLRLSGLPARFNWNAFPDHEKQELDFNHKHAEVWFPESGWIPLEPLGMRMMAGMRDVAERRSKEIVDALSKFKPKLVVTGCLHTHWWLRGWPMSC